MKPVRRVRSADPESAELATVAITATMVLEMYWRHDEDCLPVADFWRRIRTAIEVRPVADLEVALNAARGLRDVRRIFPFTFAEADEVADRIEKRAWERERQRLGSGRRRQPPVRDCACHCGSRHPGRQGICTGREDEQVKVTHVPPLTIPMCGPCALEFIRGRDQDERLAESYWGAG